MKHIRESIIGKRGSTSKGIPELKGHDIVMMNNGHHYIVIMDENEMKLTKMPFYGSQITKGILLRYNTSPYGKWSWQPLNEYDKNLKMNLPLSQRGTLDIMKVYRSITQLHAVYRTNFEYCCDEDELAKVETGYTDYKLIWER